MRRLNEFIVLGAALLLLGAAPNGSIDQVRISSGLVSGTTDRNGITAFLGIPFAAPPVEELRWRPPQPATHWQGRIFTYFFDRPIPWPAHPEFGAFHTSEVPYIFETIKLLDRPWEPVDFKLSEIMASYWSNFAQTGDPNGPGLPRWPSYTPGRHTTMELGEHVGPMPEADPAKVEFFLGFFGKS